MALTRERKEELVAAYSALLGEARALIFTEYSGMDNKTLIAARVKLREVGSVYGITKLTLLKIAMDQHGIPVPGDLQGKPIGVVFTGPDIAGTAKTLQQIAKENELFKVRGGIMDNMILSAAQVDAIADLPPLDVLQSQLLGLLDMPASNLVGVINAGLGGVVNVLNAYVDKHSEAAAD